jgi:hypothetical protein
MGEVSDKSFPVIINELESFDFLCIDLSSMLFSDCFVIPFNDQVDGYAQEDEVKNAHWPG